MNRKSVAKVQHYVPQFLLRNFGSGKNDKLSVFDKQTDRQFSTNARNVAAESRFYDVEFEDYFLTLEPSLSRVEAIAKPIVESILRTDSISHLTPEQRANLCAFLAIQLTRTRAFREQLRSIPLLLGEHLKKFGGENADLSAVERYICEPSRDELTLLAGKIVQEAPEKFGVHFATKTWLLLAADSRSHFWVGDNPVTMHNSIDMRPYGNLGLAVTGIEIYMPLSPRRALAFWCPTHEEKLRAAKNAAGTRAGAVTVSEILTAIDNGTPLSYRPENVTHFNSLQIMNAERYVFSAGDDFDLIKRMLSEQPHLRRGPRPSTD